MSRNQGEAWLSSLALVKIVNLILGNLLKQAYNCPTKSFSP